jgi:hypothetical protein
MTPVLKVLGLGVLAAVLIIAIKHRKAAKNVLALVLLLAGLAGRHCQCGRKDLSSS